MKSTIILFTGVIFGFALISMYSEGYSRSSYAQLKNLSLLKRHTMFIKALFLFYKFRFEVKYLKKDKYDYLETAILRLVNLDLTAKKTDNSIVTSYEDSIVHMVLHEFLNIAKTKEESENLWGQLHYKDKDELLKGNFKIYVYDITELNKKATELDQAVTNYEETNESTAVNPLKKVMSFTVKEYTVNNGLKGKDNRIIKLRKED